MRIAVVMNRAEYEVREAYLAKEPDGYEASDARFHNLASAILQNTSGSFDGIDLYVEAEDHDAGVMLRAEYLYTIEGDQPGEDGDGIPDLEIAQPSA